MVLAGNSKRFWRELRNDCFGSGKFKLMWHLINLPTTWHPPKGHHHNYLSFDTCDFLCQMCGKIIGKLSQSSQSQPQQVWNWSEMLQNLFPKENESTLLLLHMGPFSPTWRIAKTKKSKTFFGNFEKCLNLQNTLAFCSIRLAWS